MQQNKKRLEIYLAEYALKNKFLDTPKRREIRYNTKKFCIEHNVLNLKDPNNNLFKQYIKIRKTELNNNIIEIVLSSLPEEKRCFIIKKYRDHETSTKISLELNLSSSQQNKWQNSILITIGDYMLYKLTMKDIFYKNKIVNMIEILTDIIYFYKKYNIDIDEDYLIGLEKRRTGYYRLLEQINNCIKKSHSNIYHYVVSIKIESPNLSVNELSKKYYVTTYDISRNIKKFVSNVKKYVFL